MHHLVRTGVNFAPVHNLQFKMSDFNISYSLGRPPSTAKAAQDIWSFNRCRLYPSASGTVLAQPQTNAPSTLLQKELADALFFCKPFRTLESHFEEITAHIPGIQDHREDTLNTLADLTQSGLLESGREAWQRLISGSGKDNSESCGVCILTCDRPAALERLLLALTRAELPEQVDKVWVVDDSRESDSIKRNAEIIRKFTSLCGANLIHFDETYRKKLTERLVTRLPEAAESINWLIGRDHWGHFATYGQARNLALLLNVGKRLLMLDDDIIPEAIYPPLPSEGIRISLNDSREISLWESRESLEAHSLLLRKSPLNLMLDSLGGEAGKLLDTTGGSWETLTGLDGELLAAYDGASPIIMTQCGYWGDPGTDTKTSSLFNLSHSNLDRILKDFGDLGGTVGARAAWSGARSPTLSPHATMSAVTGADHSLLLPPYLPVGRGEDALFGVMVQRLHPHSLVLNEGWAVRHEPIEGRTGNQSLTPERASLGLSTLVDWIGRTPVDSSGLNERNRLIGISDQILTLTEREQSACESLAVQEVASRRALQLKKCMEHMSRLTMQEHLPGYAEWRSNIEASRDKLLSQISNAENDPIEAYLNSRSLDFERLRREGRNFANALRHWPSICEASLGFT